MPENKAAYLHSVLSQIQDRRPLQRSLTLENPGFKEACKQRQVPSVSLWNVNGTTHAFISPNPSLFFKVPEPAWHKPSDEQFYSYNHLNLRIPNIDFLRHHFLREGKLTESQALYLLQEATQLLSNERNLLEVEGPITGEYNDPVHFLAWRSEHRKGRGLQSYKAHLRWPRCEGDMLFLSALYFDRFIPIAYVLILAYCYAILASFVEESGTEAAFFSSRSPF